ncbi:hypothetical protein POM88_037903 [Heracleum sosnowskyi]|uniref:F-box domain-containing protein n=1 Tax=Heracleum sosnowskyi TaxID=360622 RepID=A0AAD8HRD5_9APIA|nr:hypothetical protein POM88_037903 [Heracleum sosnowskyi]
MSLSKHKNIPSYDFPEELLSEIFKRLPVKYVLRCGAVQKSWYSLIRTPLFISLHSNYQKHTAHVNPKYLVFHDTSNQEITIRYDDAQCQEYCKFDYPLDLPACSWCEQANGLRCLSTMFDKGLDYSPNIYIWNPLVQKFKTVPDSPLFRFEFEEIQWNALAFGFLPEVKDYVVIHVLKPSSTSTSAPEFFDYDYEKYYLHSVVIGVYSLNTNSWKKICQDKVFVDDMSVDQSVFVNGTAFWVGFNSHSLDQLVMYFDTKTNLVRKVVVPGNIAFHERQLESPLILPFGQYIAYFVEVNEDDPEEGDDDYGSPHLDIWVLKGDIGKFSWKKKMSVSLGENVWAEVFGLRNNGEPVLAKSNDLIAYDLDTHEPYDFVKSCDRLTPDYSYEEGSKPPFVISPFEETLVLFDID